MREVLERGDSTSGSPYPACPLLCRACPRPASSAAWHRSTSPSAGLWSSLTNGGSGPAGMRGQGSSRSRHPRVLFCLFTLLVNPPPLRGSRGLKLRGGVRVGVWGRWCCPGTLKKRAGRRAGGGQRGRRARGEAGRGRGMQAGALQVLAGRARSSPSRIRVPDGRSEGVQVSGVGRWGDNAGAPLSTLTGLDLFYTFCWPRVHFAREVTRCTTGL